MANTIATRIYDFLKDFPPFQLMEKAQLEEVARQVVVQYRRPGEIVFRQGEAPGPYIYVVREGAVHLLREEAGDRALVDQCDEGDLFGVRPLLAGKPYALTAEVVEESLLYAIDAGDFAGLMTGNPRIAVYLASTFAAGGGDRPGAAFRGRIFLDREQAFDAHFQLLEIQSLEHSKAPVTCLPETAIRAAARQMSQEEVGSIIVVDTLHHPVGIVTDKDLRRWVATGEVSLDAPVSAIMSSPVVTASPAVTVAEVQIDMIRRRIHHLCLTGDGTAASPIVGVISEHDILVLQGNNPAVLIREAGRSRTGADLRRLRERAEDLLRRYIYQEVSIAYISTVMTEINDALLVRAIELAAEELAALERPAPAAGFCWLALGSAGRGEQLLRTDQDSALVFEDVPEADLESVRTYYLDLAGRTTERLHDAGFAYCPAGMMASNPRWCLSLSEWKGQFADWIGEPTPEAVMHCSIFFDYRPAFGRRELSEQLTDFVFRQLDDQAIFLAFLARNALENPPPLTFFRNFVVEKGGEHKDAFDIKARAMMPLADAARVLILNARVSRVNNTFRRFERLAGLEPQNRELYEEAADAYEILMRYRTLQGLKQHDSGRYFRPSELAKMERINLRNSFRPIGELQSLLATRFQTAYIR